MPGPPGPGESPVRPSDNPDLDLAATHHVCHQIGQGPVRTPAKHDGHFHDAGRPSRTWRDAGIPTGSAHRGTPVLALVHGFQHRGVLRFAGHGLPGDEFPSRSFDQVAVTGTGSHPADEATFLVPRDTEEGGFVGGVDRKSTRLNSSHLVISYAVFCLKKKRVNNSARSVV